MCVTCEPGTGGDPGQSHATLLVPGSSSWAWAQHPGYRSSAPGPAPFQRLAEGGQYCFLPSFFCPAFSAILLLCQSQGKRVLCCRLYSVLHLNVYTAFSLRTNIRLTPPPVDWACGPVSLTLPEPSQGHILCWATSHLALRCRGHFLSLTFLTCKMVKLVSVCRVVVRTRDDEWSPLGC